MVKEDWNAAMSSEIFREYVQNELAKEAEIKSKPAIDDNQVLNELEDFQQKVRETPHLRRAFKALQEKFANDPVYRSKVDPKFAEGVMLLNLDISEE